MPRAQPRIRHGRDFTTKPALVAPYRAARVTGALFHTQGGLEVDAQARVLRRDGTAATQSLRRRRCRARRVRRAGLGLPVGQRPAHRGHAGTRGRRDRGGALARRDGTRDRRRPCAARASTSGPVRGGARYHDRMNATPVRPRPPMSADDKNVLGGPLAPCSTSPRTGFYRDGCCNTGPEDVGLHVVCAQVTADFLAFARDAGQRPDHARARIRLSRPRSRRSLVRVRGDLAPGPRGGRRAAGDPGGDARGDARRDSARRPAPARARPALS